MVRIQTAPRQAPSQLAVMKTKRLRRRQWRRLQRKKPRKPPKKPTMMKCKSKCLRCRVIVLPLNLLKTALPNLPKAANKFYLDKLARNHQLLNTSQMKRTTKNVHHSVRWALRHTCSVLVWNWSTPRLWLSQRQRWRKDKSFIKPSAYWSLV